MPRRSRLFQLIFVILSLLLIFALKKNSVRASTIPEFPGMLYTVTTHYDPLAWMHGADRFNRDAAVILRDARGTHPLVAHFAESADPAISFDGQRVLFAGKLHPQDPWQIWETSLEGGEPRRVSSGPEDCVRPFYLPEDRIVYARKTAAGYRIEVLDLSGGKSLPLTYGPANFFPTDILRDGRILFEAAFPLGEDVTSEIYTVYSDGSGVESYRCDHGKPRHSARQIASGDIIAATEHSLARFTSSRAQQISVAAPAGEYQGDIVETPTGDWLLSWRANASVPFQLMFWTPGAANLRPVVTEHSDAVQPVLVAQRPVPNRHPSGLHDWPNANLLCLNAYTSKYPFAPQSIHSVRLYARDEMDKPKLLGTAPVESDGSFFVQVPTEKPLQIELLDSAGKTLKRESGFFWMRRGEQRACVGCHAGPETAPENAVPRILLKSTTPADLTGATRSAAGGH